VIQITRPKTPAMEANLAGVIFSTASTSARPSCGKARGARLDELIPQFAVHLASGGVKAFTRTPS